MNAFLKLGLLPFLFFYALVAESQKTYEKLSAADRKLYDEHIIKGQPDGTQPVYIRHAYVVQYNEKYRIPNWVAYHVKPDYLKIPPREGKFSTFRTDPDIKDPVVTQNYAATGYSRGHMAPYFIMGGDRNKDGVYAKASRGDEYDNLTVFQANYMSNMCPQDQDALNGPGGPWYALETAIRNKLVKGNKMELHLVVGPIINQKEDKHFLISNKKNTGILIPQWFFQVLIYYDEDKKEYITGAFLFPHVKKPGDLPYDDLIDYIVPVDVIEEKTKLNFLSQLSEAAQKKTESQTNREFWDKKIN